MITKAFNIGVYRKRQNKENSGSSYQGGVEFITKKQLKKHLEESQKKTDEMKERVDKLYRR